MCVMCVCINDINVCVLLYYNIINDNVIMCINEY